MWICTGECRCLQRPEALAPPLEVELQTVVSSLMGAFCKCCRISFLLSRFSFLSLGWEFLHYWFSLLVFGLFRFLFLSDSILIGCRFLRIYLFLLGYSKCRYVVVHNSLLLYFVLVDLSFIYGFIYLHFLS